MDVERRNGTILLRTMAPGAVPTGLPARDGERAPKSFHHFFDFRFGKPFVESGDFVS